MSQLTEAVERFRAALDEGISWADSQKRVKAYIAMPYQEARKKKQQLLRDYWRHMERTAPKNPRTKRFDPDDMQDESWWDDYMAKDKRAFEKARDIRDEIEDIATALREPTFKS